MQRAGPDHGRFGSKADVTLLNFDVRFTPESGLWTAVAECPLWAKCGLMHRNKIRPSFDHFVGAAEQRSIFVSCWIGKLESRHHILHCSRSRTQ
jgi:hypothetical protein